MPVWGALINAVGSLGGSIANLIQGNREAKVAKYNTDQTILANKNLAEYSYQKDLEMWNRQNEYNSPAQQMERFAKAGLNPNLIYGQGNSGNASHMPSYQAPRAEYNYKAKSNPLLVMDTIGRYQDLQLRQAQIDNVKSQTDATVTRKAILSLEAIKKEIESRYWGNTLGSKYVGTVMADYLLKNRKLNAVDLELEKSSADLRRKLIDNSIRDIDLNWHKAEKWINAGTKAIGAIGINKIGAGLMRNKNYGSQYTTMPKPKLKSVVKYRYSE